MKKLMLLAAAVACIGCDQSKPALEKALAEIQMVSAQKDTLLHDLTTTSQFIADLNTEVGKVRNLNAARPVPAKPGDAEGAPTTAQQRALVLDKVREIATRLNAAEGRLVTSRKKIADMVAHDSAMAKQLAAYDSTIAAFKIMVDNQKTELANLAQQVRAMTEENTQLKISNVALVTDKATLTTERDRLTTESNTVYYVVGTKEWLLAKHIIEQTGGMLGIGKTQVPARELNPGDFTAIDKTKVAEVLFPKANTPYRIVTRQDVAALETAPDKHGVVMGGLKIRDADAFWSASKFLVVIEQ